MATIGEIFADKESVLLYGDMDALFTALGEYDPDPPGRDRPVLEVAEEAKPWLVYFISDGEGGPIKIGKSVDPARRMKSFQTHHANKLRLLAVTGDHDEGDLHRQFAAAHIRGEWYLPIRALLEFIRQLRES